MGEGIQEPIEDFNVALVFVGERKVRIGAAESDNDKNIVFADVVPFERRTVKFFVGISSICGC